MSRVSSANTRREVERKGFRYLKPSFACFPTPSWVSAKPLITFLKSATVFASRVLKTWSRSTSEIAFSGDSTPPLGIGSPAESSGGSVSSIWRLATPESENERIWATVPSSSGANCSSTWKLIRAVPLSASSISETLPTFAPPIVTTSPPTSWEALVKFAVTSYGFEPPVSSNDDSDDYRRQGHDGHDSSCCCLHALVNSPSSTIATPRDQWANLTGVFDACQSRTGGPSCLSTPVSLSLR